MIASAHFEHEIFPHKRVRPVRYHSFAGAPKICLKAICARREALDAAAHSADRGNREGASGAAVALRGNDLKLQTPVGVLWAGRYRVEEEFTIR